MPAYAQKLRYRNLWEAYWSDRTSDLAVAHLMDAFLPLVKKVFRRISIRLPNYVEREDLMQSALLGLYESIERFEPSENKSFDAFAVKRIKGAVLDELRRDDFLSRNARQKIKQLQRSTAELVSELGRAPEDEEIAARCDIDIAELNRLMGLAGPMMYLDDILLEGSERPICLKDVLEADQNTPFDETEKRDMIKHLCVAFRKLDDREQKLLYLYYYEFLRVKELAQLFGVSDARISQIHSIALLKLRALMGGG